MTNRQSTGSTVLLIDIFRITQMSDIENIFSGWTAMKVGAPAIQITDANQSGWSEVNRCITVTAEFQPALLAITQTALNGRQAPGA